MPVWISTHPIRDVWCPEKSDRTMMATKPTYEELEQEVKDLEKRVLECEVLDRTLAESEARYKAIFEHTVNGVAVYRAVRNGDDFIFIDFNRAAEKIEHIKRKDVIGKSVLEMFPAVKEFGIFDVFRRVWKTGVPEHFPLSIYKDERITGWRDNFIYKLPSGEVVAVYSDETERKKSEAALHEAHEKLYSFSQELERKVQQRTKELEDKSKELIEAERLAVLGKMANRVAHELRNPLTVIGGFVRRLQDRIPNDDLSMEYLEVILSEVMVLESKVAEIIRIEDSE
jgi:signal transduction histidine kinase